MKDDAAAQSANPLNDFILFIKISGQDMNERQMGQEEDPGRKAAERREIERREKAKTARTKA